MFGDVELRPEVPGALPGFYTVARRKAATPSKP